MAGWLWFCQKRTFRICCNIWEWQLQYHEPTTHIWGLCCQVQRNQPQGQWCNLLYEILRQKCCVYLMDLSVTVYKLSRSTHATLCRCWIISLPQIKNSSKNMILTWAHVAQLISMINSWCNLARRVHSMPSILQILGDTVHFNRMPTRQCRVLSVVCHFLLVFDKAHPALNTCMFRFWCPRLMGEYPM